MKTAKRYGFAIAFLLIAALLCGCRKTPSDVSSVYSGYAAKYLEYSPAESLSFTAGGESRVLCEGESIGGFTLTRLLTRGDEGVRASFSCDVSATGLFSYNKDEIYGSLVRFFPSDKKIFPSCGAPEPDDWFVLLGGDQPLELLGFTEGQSGEKRASAHITAYSLTKTSHRTTCYIEIDKIEDEK